MFIHTISMGLFIIYFKGSQVEILTNYEIDLLLHSLEIVFFIANSVD